MMGAKKDGTDFGLNGAIRARGALSNDVGRFERLARVAVDDGWAGEQGEEFAKVLRTEVAVEQPRTVISRNSSPDVPFDRSVNPYRGCEHGCIYCFARPGHAWLGLSPGHDFESRLVAKISSPEVLEKELRRASYRPKTIAIGTYTDPYQPIEKQYQIMRGVLEVLLRFNHPVSIVTKGVLIERDQDILKALAERGLVNVAVSVTTLDPKISRLMEPRVPTPLRRLKVIESLARAGVPVAVSASPMIPALTDHEVERIFKAGSEAGASAAGSILLRLPREVATLFEDWAREHFPDRAERILNRLRALHGGKLYEAEFGRRMTGQGIWANQMRMRVDLARKRLQLADRLPKLRTDLFEVPLSKGAQMSLF